MTRCRSCKAPIRWVKTEHGKNMPLDVEPVPDGNVVLGRGDVAIVVGPSTEIAPTTLRYRSHFATCPQRDQHRKARS